MTERAMTHNMRGSKTWNSWRGMLDRCRNPSNTNYHRYGGRGITVCSEWSEFMYFFDDMGECPEGMSLDRIDNNKGYSLSNCRWATRNTQCHNSRRRSDNTTGIRGVHRENSVAEIWIAEVREDGGRERLYKGPDFFLACCARKSWEARNGN